MSRTKQMNRKQPNDIRILTRDESIELFNNYVRSQLGISGDEFVKRYGKGEYKNACPNSRLLKALMLMPRDKQ